MDPKIRFLLLPVLDMVYNSDWLGMQKMNLPEPITFILYTDRQLFIFVQLQPMYIHLCILLIFSLFIYCSCACVFCIQHRLTVL